MSLWNWTILMMTIWTMPFCSFFQSESDGGEAVEEDRDGEDDNSTASVQLNEGGKKDSFKRRLELLVNSGLAEVCILCGYFLGTLHFVLHWCVYACTISRPCLYLDFHQFSASNFTAWTYFHPSFWFCETSLVMLLNKLMPLLDSWCNVVPFLNCLKFFFAETHWCVLWNGRRLTKI